MSQLAQSWAYSVDTDEMFHSVSRLLKSLERPIAGIEDLKEPQKTALKRQFKNAGMAMTTLEKYMREVAEHVGLNPDQSVVIPDMKDPDRAATKFMTTDRDMHDLGRGRILFDMPRQYAWFKNHFERSKGCRNFHDSWKNKDRAVKIIEGTVQDYIREPRSSGYTGSVNFDVAVKYGKGRAGELEIQFMHREMQETYDQSHILYEMIRLLDEKQTPALADQQLRAALIAVNAALWDEAARDCDMLQFRNEPPEICDIGQALAHSNIISVLTAFIIQKNESSGAYRTTLDALGMAQDAFVTKHLRAYSDLNEKSMLSRQRDGLFVPIQHSAENLTAAYN